MEPSSDSPLLNESRTGHYTCEASTISRIYIDYHRRPNKAISKRDEDILRKNYLAMMKRKTWKDELIAVAETLINETRAARMKNLDLLQENQENLGNLENLSHPSDPLHQRMAAAENLESLKSRRRFPAKLPPLNPSEVIDIRYGQKVVMFQPSRAKVVTIGRCKGCDVVLHSTKPPWTCSRLHAVVYLLPDLQKLIVADVGSFHGIKTVWRSSNLFPKESSLPGSRHLMEFSLRESFWLKLGSELVICNGLHPLDSCYDGPQLDEYAAPENLDLEISGISEFSAARNSYPGMDLRMNPRRSTDSDDRTGLVDFQPTSKSGKNLSHHDLPPPSYYSESDANSTTDLIKSETISDIFQSAKTRESDSCFSCVRNMFSGKKR